MSCIHPDEIQEGDLLAYIEGTASQQVRDHIKRCPYCAAEAASLTHLDRRLSVDLYRDECPPTETWVQYQAGLLPARERRELERHLELCPLCSDELQRIAALDEPQVSLWEELRRAARAVVEAIQVEPPLQPAYAVRGSPSPLSLYRADELDVALNTAIPHPHAPSRTLRGRITDRGLAAAEMTGRNVRLLRQDRIVDVQAIDDLGYFVFEGLAAGEYDLWIEGPQADLVLRQVTIQPPAPNAP